MPSNSTIDEAATDQGPAKHASIDQQCEKAWALRYSAPHKAIKEAEQILRTAHDKGYIWGEARAHQIIGACQTLMSEFESALDNLQIALNIFQTRRYAESAAETTAHIATTYTMMEQFDIALNWQFKALEKAAQLELRQVHTNTLYNIGVIYNELGDHEQALKYHQKALANKKQLENDEFNIITSLSAMGEVYQKMERYVTALEYQHEALSKAKLLGMPYAVAVPMLRIGEIRMARKEYKDAESTLNKALENLADSDGHRPTFVETQLSLCALYARTGRHEEALAAGNSALKIAKDIGLLRLQARCYQYLSQAEEEAGNYQRALQELKVHNRIKEDAIRANAQQTFIALQRYQEIEDQVHESAQYKQQSIELGQANEAMQEQQENLKYTITQFKHSIAYASRIQQAMLPPVESIDKQFSDSMVLFMPRDGVSGDFYYMQALEDESVIVAAADCTGHGVPGALLGMLGHSLLNLIVNERGYHRPDKILKLLDLYIREVLCRQNPGQKMNDGMDISLIHYQPKRRVFQYAGAMNPLYWVRDGQVQKVEADRVGIGGTHKGLKNFHLNEIPVDKGDCLYLFTDGYHDQFGPGKTRQKKFTPKRMRQILAEIHDLPMSQQRDYLETQLRAHQGKLSQTDDILVMGLVI